MCSKQIWRVPILMVTPGFIAGEVGEATVQAYAAKSQAYRRGRNLRCCRTVKKTPPCRDQDRLSIHKKGIEQMQEPLKINPETAELLATQASERGRSVEDYLKRLLGVTPEQPRMPFNLDEFLAGMESLADDVEPLPRVTTFTSPKVDVISRRHESLSSPPPFQKLYLIR